MTNRYPTSDAAREQEFNALTSALAAWRIRYEPRTPQARKSAEKGLGPVMCIEDYRAWSWDHSDDAMSWNTACVEYLRGPYRLKLADYGPEGSLARLVRGGKIVSEICVTGSKADAVRALREWRSATRVQRDKRLVCSVRSAVFWRLGDNFPKSYDHAAEVDAHAGMNG